MVVLGHVLRGSCWHCCRVPRALHCLRRSRRVARSSTRRPLGGPSDLNAELRQHPRSASTAGLELGGEEHGATVCCLKESREERPAGKKGLQGENVRRTNGYILPTTTCSFVGVEDEIARGGWRSTPVHGQSGVVALELGHTRGRELVVVDLRLEPLPAASPVW